MCARTKVTVSKDKVDVDVPVPGIAAHGKQRRVAAAPAVFWAAVGAIFLGFAAWVLVRWILGGGLHQVPAGGQMSPARTVVLWIVQGIIIAADVGIAGLIIRRARREGRIGFDAALFFGYLSAFWMDPVADDRNLVVTFNPHALNVSSWGSYLPGWHGPAGQAETIFSAGVFAYALLAFWAWLPWLFVCWITKQRPQWGSTRTLVLTAVVAVATEAVLEIAWVLTGMYSWQSGAPFALFGGHWYQVPLFELLLIPLLISAPPVIILYRAKRAGADAWPVRGTNRTWLRVLATAGFVQAAMLAYLVAVVVWTTVFPSHVPADTPLYLQL